MSFDISAWFVGLLCSLLVAYVGFGAAVLVYRHAWALRQAKPKAAFKVQIVFGLTCSLVGSMFLDLARLQLGWGHAGDDNGPAYLLMLVLSVIALTLLSVEVAVVERRHRARAKTVPLTADDPGLLSECPHCHALVGYDRWLVVHDEPGRMACPECRQVCVVDEVYPPVKRDL